MAKEDQESDDEMSESDEEDMDDINDEDLEFGKLSKQDQL